MRILRKDFQEFNLISFFKHLIHWENNIRKAQFPYQSQCQSSHFFKKKSKYNRVRVIWDSKEWELVFRDIIMIDIRVDYGTHWDMNALSF